MNEIRTLNIDEACQLLHTHKSTLYQKIASGEIPPRAKTWVTLALSVLQRQLQMLPLDLVALLAVVLVPEEQPIDPNV